MKICLINPPNRALNNFESRQEIDIGLPLGIMQLAAVLEKDNQTMILDCIISKNADFHEINEKWVRFSIPEEEIIESIKNFEPDIIGITCRFTSQILETLYIADLVKKINKNLPIIIGGSAFVAEGKEFLKNNKDIDIIVIGEGERTVIKLVEYFNKKRELDSIDGIIFRDKNKIKETRKVEFIKNLDELPLPAYHLIDMETFFELKSKRSYRTVGPLRSISMITSRGCPFSCIFCVAHLSMGKLWRPYSPEYIKKHILFLKERYSIEHIFFEDDNTSLNPERFEKLLDILKELKITWDVPNGLRADTLNEEVIKKIKDSGCSKLIVAPESGDQEILDKVIKKNLNLKKVEEVAKLCKKYGIFLSAFYIIGFPGETVKNMENTINFALRLKRKYNVGVATIMYATPLKGSELYNICKKNEYLIKEVTSENMLENALVKGGFIETNEFKTKDLKRLKKKFTRLAYIYSIPNYLTKPKRLIKKLSNINNIKVIARRFLKPNL